MTATPLSITGPASLIAAVPYLLGFEPADSLVLVGLQNGRLIVSARLDLDDLDRPNAVADVMTVLAVRAECTEVVAVTYGQRTEPELVSQHRSHQRPAAARTPARERRPVLVDDLPDRATAAPPRERRSPPTTPSRPSSSATARARPPHARTSRPS